jgi:diacylglycerol kinase (ATP)
MPLRKWIKSANFAIEGILHAARTQRHLRYHFYAASIVLIGSYALGVTRNEFLIIALAVMAVLVAEMLNSAIEAIVDILAPEHHESARAAKDIAAGAVLITAMGSIVVGYVLLFPYLKNLFQEGVDIGPRPREELSVIAFIIVLIIVVLMKAYFGKGHPLRGGMPSGHAALSFSVWVSVTYNTRNFVASLLCLMLALGIAQSRVTTKAHKPVEVVMGAALGALVTFVLFLVLS